MVPHKNTPEKGPEHGDGSKGKGKSDTRNGTLKNAGYEDMNRATTNGESETVTHHRRAGSGMISRKPAIVSLLSEIRTAFGRSIERHGGPWGGCNACHEFRQEAHLHLRRSQAEEFHESVHEWHLHLESVRG